MGRHLRPFIVAVIAAGLVALALPQGASASSVRVCVEQNSYSFTPPLDVVPTMFGNGGLSFTSNPCASVIVNEGGDILRIPQPGPGASGGFPFSYFGGCAIAFLDGSGAGPEIRVIVGGVVQVAATNEGGTVHAKAGVLVPNAPCPISTAEGPALSAFVNP